MFSWALTFLVVAIIAGLFGFFGVAGTATSAAKILFFIGIVFAIISFIAGRSPRNLG